MGRASKPFPDPMPARKSVIPTRILLYPLHGDNPHSITDWCESHWTCVVFQSTRPLARGGLRAGVPSLQHSQGKIHAFPIKTRKARDRLSDIIG